MTASLLCSARHPRVARSVVDHPPTCSLPMWFRRHVDCKGRAEVEVRVFVCVWRRDGDRAGPSKRCSASRQLASVLATSDVTTRPSTTRKTAESRRLKCYRARIVAPFAMLPCPPHGESHRECTKQTGVRASDLSTVPPGAPAGEGSD